MSSMLLTVFFEDFTDRKEEAKMKEDGDYGKKLKIIVPPSDRCLSSSTKIAEATEVLDSLKEIEKLPGIIRPRKQKKK